MSTRVHTNNQHLAAGYQRRPVSKQITFGLTVDPGGWTRRAHQLRQPLLSISSPMKFHPRSLGSPSGEERRWASPSSESLCWLWHACGNSWPLSSALTATLVTTGTERLACHGFVSSGSRITSHLSQDSSSDLLFPLKQMNVIRPNAAGRSHSLLMVVICSCF